MERASLKVIEAEFALEVFVHSFRSPAFLDDSNVLLVTHAARQRREIKPGSLVIIEWPFDDEPLLLSLIDRGAVIMGCLDSTEREAPP